MKRRRVDSNIERQLLIGLATSDAFIAGSAAELDVSLFESKHIRRIAGWCLKHFRRYEAAPKTALQNIYHAWVAREKPDDDDAEATRDLLEDLSAESDRQPELNVPHLMGVLSEYLTGRRLMELQASIGDCLLRGKNDEALGLVQKFRGVSVDDPVGYDPTSKAAVDRAFKTPPKPLIEFGGDAGIFFNEVLTRDSLIGIQGPEKRGKTFWCLEFAYRALRARMCVALFEVGDLTEMQLNRRVVIRMAGMPLWRSQCKGLRIPTKISVNDDGALVRFKRLQFNSPIDRRKAHHARKRFRRLYKLKGNRQLRFSVHANSTINVAGISAILERWKYEDGFVPDVIIIDYADILAPEDSQKEPRHQVNDTWKALRRLSQDWHACVIAPTQANAASYSAQTQGMRHVSEDKRKYAHVTAMLGLNQTDEEKQQQVMRLNWLVVRESEFHTKRCLWVGQCTALGRALCVSTFGRKKF